MGYILFSSEEKLSIQASPKWDGTIEYSVDNLHWYIWHGEEIINNIIYLRGINNTVISHTYPWIINGKNIKCQGNIENLLDYKSVINHIHPKMNNLCFCAMFFNCVSLIEAPQLLCPLLMPSCYFRMFTTCSLLTTPPIFPNWQIAKEAIMNQEIFYDCPIQFININNKLYDINVLKLL